MLEKKLYFVSVSCFVTKEVHIHATSEEEAASLAIANFTPESDEDTIDYSERINFIEEL